MLICGIEITANEAVVCLLSYANKAFTVPDCRARSFTIAKSAAISTDSIRYFHASVKKLIEDYKVDEVVIIERPINGKYAGTRLGFKMEAAIQLLELPVSTIDHTRIKAQFKRNPLTAEYEDLGLKVFQQQAFNAAYGYQNELIYSDE